MAKGVISLQTSEINSIVESCNDGSDEALELWIRESLMVSSSSNGIGGNGASVRVASTWIVSDIKTGNILKQKVMSKK